MIYKVGGSIRDELLQRECHDNDYVVVGSTVEEMLKLGYKQVGADFPVFLHPQTREEYALARKEISTGEGYTDFKFEFGPDITLREDLERRDFTINALAKDLETNEIIDYFNGKTDLQNRIIRHINSEHFIEDPLRVLRGIRFCCQLDGFMIAEDTLILMRDMVHKGMLEHLTSERVWKEVEKALHTKNFDLFIHYLDVIDGLKVVLPEVAALKEVPENLIYHPEGNVYAHTLMALKEVHSSSLEEEQLALLNFGVLCHDLGKQDTDSSKWPSHHEHENLGGFRVDMLCDRLKVPNVYRDFGKIACKYHMHFYKFLDMHVKKQYDMIEALTRFKDNLNLTLLQKVHLCDLKGKDRYLTDAEIQYMLNTINQQNLIFLILKDVGLKDLPEDKQNILSNFKGEKFGKLYRDAKISYLKGKLHSAGKTR